MKAKLIESMTSDLLRTDVWAVVMEHAVFAIIALQFFVLNNSFE